MTNEELILRVQKLHRSDDIELLIVMNEGLVASCAMRYRGLEDMDDLKQEGVYALLKAAEAWRPDRGANFAAFSYNVIMRHLQRYISDFGVAIRIPAYRQRLIMEYKQVAANFNRDHGRPATREELAELLNLDSDQLEQVEKDERVLHVKSFSEPVDEEGLTIEDQVEDPDDPIEQVIDNIFQKEVGAVVWPIVDELEPLEAEIVKRRYEASETRQKAAEALGMTDKQLYQIEKTALLKLRRRQQLRALHEEIVGQYIMNHTTLGYFKRSHTSDPEWIVQKLESEDALW